MGTERLHPSIEVREKGGRPSEGASAFGWRLGQPEGGGVGGSQTSDGSDGSCYREVQQLHKEKVEEDGGFGTEGYLKDRKEPGAAAQLPVAAPDTCNHNASSWAALAAANGLGAEAFVSATITAHGRRSELGGATRKRKAVAYSIGISRSARPPSSYASSVRTEISNGGGVTSYMHVTSDHQMVKDPGVKGEEQQLINGAGISNGKNKGGKRRHSPAVLMEGSRCSRVNGRGWRCSQQTLVGYSLCEHHLGKGRLRSVSSVECKKTGVVRGTKKLPSLPVSQVLQHHDKPHSMVDKDDDEDDDYMEESKPAVRRKRVGTVKARSLSSLLVQTTSEVNNYAGVAHEEIAPMIATAAALVGLSTNVLTPR